MRRSSLNSGFIGVNKTNVKKAIFDIRKQYRIKTNQIENIFEKQKVISSWYRFFQRLEGKYLFVVVINQETGIEETRPLFMVYGQMPFNAFYSINDYYSGSTLNYVIASEDLNHPSWSKSAGSSLGTGYLAPDNSYNAWRIDNPGSLSQNVYLPIGHTYIYSFYHNVTQGNTGLYLGGYYNSGNNRIKFRQTMPIEATQATEFTTLTYPNDGVTGWRRFAFEFYTTDYLWGRLSFSYLNINSGTGKSIYYWGPQIEKIS